MAQYAGSIPAAGAFAVASLLPGAAAERVRPPRIGHSGHAAPKIRRAVLAPRAAKTGERVPGLPLLDIGRADRGLDPLYQRPTFENEISRCRKATTSRPCTQGKPFGVGP